MSDNRPPYDGYWRGDPGAEETERFSAVGGPSPWYRNPIILVALGLFVAILLGLALYLIGDRSTGHGGTTQTPTSPTTSATTTGVTTTAPVAPPETTTMTFPPSTTEPTTAAPTTAPTTTPSVDEGHHHHHHHDGGTP